MSRRVGLTLTALKYIIFIQLNKNIMAAFQVYPQK